VHLACSLAPLKVRKYEEKKLRPVNSYHHFIIIILFKNIIIVFMYLCSKQILKIPSTRDCEWCSCDGSRESEYRPINTFKKIIALVNVINCYMKLHVRKKCYFNHQKIVF
jgi:hypothetical protein